MSYNHILKNAMHSLNIRHRYDGLAVEHNYTVIGKKNVLFILDNHCIIQTTDETKRSVFSAQLKQQLKNKRMIYTKDQLFLSTTVGQGECDTVQ